MIGFLRVDDDRPMTGRHMLAIIGLFFGTIILVNGVMAAVAIRTFPGLNARNGFVASQDYNRLLAAARAQEATGWRASLRARDGRLSFSLASRIGTPLRGMDVTAHLGRPATAREDRFLTFVERGQGYETAETLPPGRWAVDLKARRGEVLLFQRSWIISVPAGPVP